MYKSYQVTKTSNSIAMHGEKCQEKQSKDWRTDASSKLEDSSGKWQA